MTFSEFIRPAAPEHSVLSKQTEPFHFKDIINTCYCLSKNANFPIEKSNDEITSYIIK